MKIKKFLYSQKVAPYVFVIPFILSFAIFWIYPLCSSVFMSFEKITPLKTSFVGIENYKKLLSDTVFQTAIKNSATYMFWTLVLLIPFPMLFAVLMDRNGSTFGFGMLEMDRCKYALFPFRTKVN